jgi:hypothetical protein
MFVLHLRPDPTANSVPFIFSALYHKEYVANAAMDKSRTQEKLLCFLTPLWPYLPSVTANITSWPDVIKVPHFAHP